MPAQPQSRSLSWTGWGALSVPRKNLALPETAAAQREAVRLALGHRQAIHVRPEAAGEERIAVDHQMMRGDGGGQVAPGASDEIGGLPGGDVLEHDLQRRQALRQRFQ